MTDRIGVSGHQSVPAPARLLFEGVLDEIITPSLVGVSALAAGADQIFAHAVVRAGGGLVAVVPSKDYETTFSRTRDLESYRELLAVSASVIRLEFETSSEEAYMAAGRRVVDESDVLLALWDGKPAQGLGGTGDVVKYAREIGRRVQVVWPPGVTR